MASTSTASLAFVDGAENFRRFLGSAYTHAFGLSPVKPGILFYSLDGTRHLDPAFAKHIHILVSAEPFDMANAKQRNPRLRMIMDTKKVASLRPARVPFVYLPFYSLSFAERFQNTSRDLLHRTAPPAPFVLKPRFCAFLYKQDVAFRNEMFDVVNSYKPVAALGRCRNASPTAIGDRALYDVGKRTYMDSAVDQYRPFKFVICCENSSHPGYVTEKIMHAFLAESVPIYFGAPDITKHFNKNSFIDVRALGGIRAAMPYIKKLEQNEDLWAQVAYAPLFSIQRLTRCFHPRYLARPLQSLAPEAAIAHQAAKLKAEQ